MHQIHSPFGNDPVFLQKRQKSDHPQCFIAPVLEGLQISIKKMNLGIMAAGWSMGSFP